MTLNGFINDSPINFYLRETCLYGFWCFHFHFLLSLVFRSSIQFIHSSLVHCMVVINSIILSHLFTLVSFFGIFFLSSITTSYTMYPTTNNYIGHKYADYTWICDHYSLPNTQSSSFCILISGALMHVSEFNIWIL